MIRKLKLRMFQIWDMLQAFSQNLIFTARNEVWESNTGGSPCDHRWTCSNLFTWDTLTLGPESRGPLTIQGTSGPTSPDKFKLVQIGPHHTASSPLSPPPRTGWKAGSWPSTERPSCIHTIQSIVDWPFTKTTQFPLLSR